MPEPARQTPVLAETDVLVCGGGAAGVGAALAAARSGARTFLIEHQSCVGGMATSGMMNRLGPYHDEREMIVGGIPWEVLQRLIAMNAAHTPEPCPHSDPDRYWIPFDPEALKFLLDTMLEDSHVDVLLHAYGVGVVGEKGAPGGVIVESKSGRHAILAKVIVDATGDGDVAALAGASFEKGRTSDGLMQPMTTLFKVGDLDREKVKSFLAEPENRSFAAAKADGETFPGYVGPGSDNLLRPRETYFNVNHVFGADGTDAASLSRATIAARRRIWAMLRFCKRYVPGFENTYLIATAAQLGVRESRRVVGDYILTVDDVLCARKFEDAVARYACWVDIHTMDPTKQQEAHSGRGLEPGTSYDIPYRCLVPKQVENLLVAGRCLSATHEALASARMIPCCMAMGQAAGTAAALAVTQNVRPRNLDTQRLRAALHEQDVRI
ncbi:MAG: hypothetical protein A3K19_04470 [Lentisphaerae bacterium RIFOXYB12_FULL_65_16]|nr:MAG: hypothetical protein A3K18_34940 [Lentisphaerae bacterium RIFOXYA12_64_32]OGV84609.1 MAG: hypothetical protein A3K19_04470 [Lentisphaerae bacterium RIFOXYB12_FULL_65_16]